MTIDGIERIATEINSEKHQLPSTIVKNQKAVKKGFWKKIARVASLIPFAHELLSAYYCSIDPKAPTRVRAILLAALAYFIVPTDLIPDFIVGLGFSDDASVLTAAIGIVAGHISDKHKSQAKSALRELEKATS
jgi:uncharacterized membrane protein YkvA (DUF1232 family)